MKRLGILVGHHGPGTGATFNPSDNQIWDEWIMADMDSRNVARKLDGQAGVHGEIISINRLDGWWAAVDSIWGLGQKLNNVKIRAEWARAKGCDLAIELHYNSHSKTHWTDRGGNLHEINGHQVMVRPDSSPESLRLAACMAQAFDSHLPNKSRGIKKANLSILRRLADIPCILLEPAFIFESAIRNPSWPGDLAYAIQEGIITFVEGDSP